MQKRFVKVYDANTGFFYFVDTRTRAVSWEPPKALWRDERYKVTSRRDGVDPVACKRQAMARAAAKIMTPRSWAAKHQPRGNLEPTLEEESEEEEEEEEEEEVEEETDEEEEAVEAPQKWQRVPAGHEVFDPAGDFDVTRGRVLQPMHRRASA